MADTGLFSRLRRLFSTDVIIRNEGDNQLKVFDINKIQISGEYETNALVDTTNYTVVFIKVSINYLVMIMRFFLKE